jgi:hypothetical protein
MKKIFPEAMLLFLLLPFLSANSTNPRLDFFEIPSTFFEPIREDMSNLDRAMDVHVKKSCFLSFTIHLENTAIQGHLINPTGDPEVKNTSGYILVSPQQYERYYFPGDVVRLSWRYPKEYLLDSNIVFVTITARFDFNDMNPVNIDSGFPVRIFHPKTWDLGIKGPCVRNGAMGWIYRYPSPASNECWTSEHKGFENEIENPGQNAVPLSSALLRSLDYDGLPQRFSYQKAFLRLHEDDGTYTIGYPDHDAVEKWRDFPLELASAVNSTNLYAAFRLADTYAVSPDGRYMKKASERNSRDYLCHQLYLPPVKNNETKLFSFTLYIEGAGELGLDRFIWNFTIRKNKNYFGSFPNSDYAVEVI